MKILLTIEIDGHSIALNRDVPVPHGLGSVQITVPEQANRAREALEGIFSDADHWLTSKTGTGNERP